MAATKKTASPAAEKPVRKPTTRAKKKAEPEPTHEVLRTVVIDGEERAVGDLVHLDGLNANALESHGYVRAYKGTELQEENLQLGSD